ncbi:MAG: helix-turn-helix transcriptional regulator [Spirochaetes bacterium]|jgi:transcriptional regulator with XRE-family HTH domain|nr:helix-turn-helix transcriptional regulator [Spirochaetota bacterium]
MKEVTAMRTQVKSEDYQNYLDDLTGYYSQQEKAEEKTFIGERLKKIREMQGISLEKLARLAGVEERYLREIENVKVFPDLGTIIRLSKALRVATGIILDEESGFSYSVIRREDRRDTRRTPSGNRDNPQYLYQSLSTGVVSRHMESFIVTLPAGGTADELSSHEGEEFLYVLEGEITIRLGKKEEILREGDSIYYLSTVPHSLKSSGGGQAQVLAVVYTG